MAKRELIEQREQSQACLNFAEATEFDISSNEAQAPAAFFRSVIAFGRIHIIENEQEKLETARMLGNRYNPNDDESLQKEIESGFSRMLMIRFDIKHLTGKEAIELVKQRQ
jgi:nitroimidazol reductase NimA-like FMN-containing flavoprotein (pyridoxamine 5'-phosphate oxidase superfamily)